MRLLARLALWIYPLLLGFYPQGFRAEFKEEMKAVFSAAVHEHQKSGGGWLLRWVLREFADWPAAVLREHLRARRNRMLPDKFMHEKPLPRGEWLAAMIIFLLPLAIPIISYLASTGASIPEWLDTFMLILFWGAAVAALVLAIFKGLPPWSLSYLGFYLMVGILLARYDRIWAGWIYPEFIQSFGPRSLWSLAVRIGYGAVFAVIILFSILLSALILVNLLRLLPDYSDVWGRMRADWTQLSFVVYGGLVPGILITFDEYHYIHIWLFLAWTILALGAWFYLRARSHKQRVLALVGGASGAMWIVALAKWVLIPLQNWPDGYPVAPSPTTRWVETGGALAGWGLIVLLLLAPALLKLLPALPPQRVQEEVSARRFS